MPRSLRRKLVSQFRQPTGSLGRLAGWIMTRRGSNRERNFWTVSLLDLRPRDRVLEIGFGPGLAIEAAAHRARDGRVVGVDHSEVMWRMASKRNRDEIRAGRVELHCTSVGELRQLGKQFDAIFSVNCMMFWSDPAQTCAALLNMLELGGTLAITHQPRKPGANDEDVTRSIQEIEALFRTVGLEDIRHERLDLQPVAAVCVLGRRPELS